MSNVVLITGGFGYVGSRVVKYLLTNTNYNIRVSTHREVSQAPAWFTNGEVVQLDLESEDIGSVCADVKYIVHLAALNEIDSAKDPASALKVNSLGTLKLLAAAEKLGVERFIYLSTARVYGAPLVGRITEETLPRPSHPYAITHRVAEDFVLSAHDRRSIIGVVLRLSNSYGAPASVDVDRWTLVVNDFCRQAVTTGKLILNSSGLQVRNFITLEDVARAISHFLNLPSSECGDGLFNVGSEHSLRIIDIAEQIVRRCEDVLGFKPTIDRPIFSDKETSEYLHYDICKLKSTGFSLTSQMDMEIGNTLLLCRESFGGF